MAEEARGEVKVALRFTPQVLEAYLDRARSPESFIKVIESAFGGRLDEWERKLLEQAWHSVALGAVPFFEIYPITTVEAYVKSYVNEVLMHAENVKSHFEKTMQSCAEVYASLPDVVKSGRLGEVEHVVEDCVKLTEHGPRLALILSVFILEHTYRKAQFSLPLGRMSNAAKGKAGIWTD